MLSDFHRESINRIRLEFKAVKECICTDNSTGINRIRLEFKAIPIGLLFITPVCINRIRLEFKAVIVRIMSKNTFVLIESDWNLKPYFFVVLRCREMEY